MERCFLLFAASETLRKLPQVSRIILNISEAAGSLRSSIVEEHGHDEHQHVFVGWLHGGNNDSGATGVG